MSKGVFAFRYLKKEGYLLKDYIVYFGLVYHLCNLGKCHLIFSYEKNGPDGIYLLV
jgi:hypothetical protein